MKKVIALLFVGTMITFAACQSKPKTEEAAVDSTATMTTDSAAVDSAATDSAATDSAAVAPADSAK
ncbi:hypothetical protein [Arsenicibacter rosenii]|uniref:Entericidin n=1 Tax=Arsenicibacter rosenii TaxID=1750698 RepID=A0A1S2VRH9_9BACT|nr:hypothetical protein [Arsenicibacter rosenii]OIN60468.1 hypothetical protein BLX24_06515 [Arsenicibacter rosenii]